MAAILSPGRRRILVLLALWLGAETAHVGPCDLLGGDGDGDGDGICDTCQCHDVSDDAGCAPTEGMIELSTPADVNYDFYLTVPAGVTCQRWTGTSGPPRRAATA